MIYRPKNRYVLVETSHRAGLEDPVVCKNIADMLRDELGTLEYVNAYPKIVSVLGERTFIVRINRGYEDKLILSLCFVRLGGGREIGFRTLKSSGSVKKLKKYAVCNSVYL